MVGLHLNMTLAERRQAGEVPKIVFKEFEGVRIQWEKGAWNFDHTQNGPVVIDTYSIWNPEHHAEIAERLLNGETAALYLMGNFGVAQVRTRRNYNQSDAMFDSIKKRDRSQSLAAFVHPYDIADMVDFERLPGAYSGLRDASKRLSLYAGPMHLILPIKEENLPDLGKIREEKTASFFWIPGHTGYEELYGKFKDRIEGAVLGGGSLNTHGQEPSYNTQQLKYEMGRHPDWQENIDFIIFDELAESFRIGRSHTQVSFVTNPPKVVRRGSVSAETISQRTGYPVVSDNPKLASSATPYDSVSNKDTDRKIKEALQMMERYQAAISTGSKSSGPQI